MDADTRHELKQNDLASALTKLQLVETKKWLQLIGLVVLGVAIVVGYKVWAGMRESARDRAWSELSLTNPEAPKDGEDPLAKLRQLVNDNHDAAFQAAARTKLAAALLVKASKDDAQSDALLREASQTLAGAPRSGVAAGFRASAELLQAQVHESLHEFDKARALYESIAKNPDYAGFPQAQIAPLLSTSLDKIQVEAKFLPGMKPMPTPPTTAPGQTQLPKSLTEALAEAGLPATSQPTGAAAPAPAPTPGAPAAPAPTPAPATATPDSQPSGGAPATP